MLILVAIVENYYKLGAIKDHQAATSLGLMGEVAQEPLLMLLKDADSEVRYYAAVALGELRDVRALSDLELVALQDQGQIRQGQKVAGRAQRSIKQIKARPCPS